MSGNLTETVDVELLQEPVTVFIDMGDGADPTVYETSQLKRHPFDFDASAFLPNHTPMTMEIFWTITSQLIQKTQEFEGIESDKQVALVEWYPPEELDQYMKSGEVITYRVVRREPGNMNPAGTGRPHRKSTFSHSLQTPDEPNKVVVVESRPVDHTLEMSCWSKTNKKASERAIWLEKLLLTNEWAYQVKGAERFYWKDRGPDTYIASGQQRLFQRPLQFFLRFREFEVKSHPRLQDIEVLLTPTTGDLNGL